MAARKPKPELDDVTEAETQLDPAFLRQLKDFLRHQGYELTKAAEPRSSGSGVRAEVSHRGTNTRSGEQLKAKRPSSGFGPLGSANLLPSRRAPAKGQGMTPWTLIEVVSVTEGDAPNFVWLTMRDQNGHLYKWHGSSPNAHRLRVGETTLIRGNVVSTAKNMTVITRVRTGGEDEGRQEGDEY